MTIYRYKVPTAAGVREAFGCPVEVRLAGRRVRLIYQFQGGGQARAVVHYESGQVVCPLTDEHVGAPQIAAQIAVDGLARWTFDNAPVINPGTPERVGTFGGSNHVRLQSAES